VTRVITHSERESRGAVPPRIANGPSGDRGRLKAQILARPGSVEEGLRVLDADLPAGPAGSIDLVLLDRDGALVLLAIATDDPDAALLRLLDQHVWAAEQRGVLLRLYGTAGLRAGAPLRGLLLSPAFAPAFLRRLSLLSARVEAYLARPIPEGEDAESLIEPAAALFGGPDGGVRAPAPPAPAAPAPADEPARRSEPERPPIGDGAAAAEPAEAELLDPLDDLPLPPGFDLDLPAAADEPFEPLTADEMEAFEVFERQRRTRERRSS
jgi:hypothetical protein